MSDFLRDSGEYEIVGFTDTDKSLVGSKFNGAQVVGDDDAVIQYFKADKIDCAFMGLGESDLSLRARLYQRFVDAGVPMPSFIHPAANIASTASIAEGTVVLPFAYVAHRARVGRNVFVGYCAGVEHDNVVADHTYISPHCAIGGFVTLGERVLLGLNCTVFPRTTVGADSRIGAGAVVSGEIAAGTTVFASLSRAVPSGVSR